MSEKAIARLEAVQAVTEEGQSLQFRVVLDKAVTQDISFEVTADGYIDWHWGASPEVLFQSRGSSEMARAFGRYSVTVKAGESFAELSILTQDFGYDNKIQMLKMGLNQPSGDAEVAIPEEAVCAAVMDNDALHWDREKLKNMTVRVVPGEEFDALFQQTLQKYAAERGMSWEQLEQDGQNDLRKEMLTWMRGWAAEQGAVNIWREEIYDWEWGEIFSDFLAASCNVMLVPAAEPERTIYPMERKPFSQDEIEQFSNALAKEHDSVSHVMTREQFLEQSKQILTEGGDVSKGVMDKLMAVAADLVLNEEMEFSRFEEIYQAGEAKLDEAILEIMPTWFAFSQQVHWTIKPDAALLPDNVKQRTEQEMAELGSKSLSDSDVLDAPVTRHARLDILLFVTLKRNKMLDAVKAAGAKHFGDVQKLSQVSEFLSGKQLKIFETVNRRMPDGFNADSVRDGVCYGLAAEYLAAEVYRKKGGDAFLNRLQQVFGGLERKDTANSVREQLTRQYRREQGADALADPIVKLFQYQASTRNQDPIFKKEGAQTGFESDADVNIHDLVTRKLGGDKDKFFLISSDNHAMAVTKRDGVYSFFEPNTGVTRTSDPAAFERLLNSYFDGMMRAGYWPSKIGQSADAATFEIESLEAIKGSTEKPNWLQQVEAEQDWVAAELQKRGIETALSEQATQRREATGADIDAAMNREGFYGRKRQLYVGEFDVRICMQKSSTDADYQLTKSRVRAALKQLKGVPEGLHRRIEVVAGSDVGERVLIGTDRIMISLGSDFFDGKSSLAGLNRADAGKAHVLRQLAVAIQEQADPDTFDPASGDVKAAANAFVQGQLLPDSPGITRQLSKGRAQAYLAVVDAVNQLNSDKVDQNLALFNLQQATGEYLQQWPQDSQAELIRGLYEHAIASAGELNSIQSQEKASADPSMKDFIKALSPKPDAHGKLVNLRKNQYFLDGYTGGEVSKVPGFQEGMSLKKLVALFTGGSLSKEQQGTIAREIEYRYFQESMPDTVSESNKLFRDAAGHPAGGNFDARARQQLAPQGFLLNLINDGNGGRCDPLSKLMLVAQNLAASGQKTAGSRLLQNFFSVVTVINNPNKYSAQELANAKVFMSDVRRLHKKNDSDFVAAVRGQWSVENKQPLTLDGVLAKLTPTDADGQLDLTHVPVFLEVDTKFHAMSAWSRTEDGKRIFGFYDPNTGLVEFSSSAKFSEYMHGHFGKDGMNFAGKYKMGLDTDGKTPLFECVTSFNADELGKFKTGPFSPSVLDTLNREIFEPAADKAPAAVDPEKAVQNARDLVTDVRDHDANATIRLFADQLLGDDGLKNASVDAYLRLQASGKGSDALLENIHQANEILRREKLGLATDDELLQIGELRKILTAATLEKDSYVTLDGQQSAIGLKGALEAAGIGQYKLTVGDQSLAVICDAANHRYAVYIAGQGEVKGFANLDAMTQFAADYLKDKGDWSLSGLKPEVALMDMDGVMSSEQLVKEASVFGKRRGDAYNAIVDVLSTFKSESQPQPEAAFKLIGLIDSYTADHPNSGRNNALRILKEQLETSLFGDDSAALKRSLTDLTGDRPNLAAAIYSDAQRELGGEDAGITDFLIRWVNEDPMLAGMKGYSGNTPGSAELGFEAKYHIDISAHYTEITNFLGKAQQQGLLTKATIDADSKILHLGYSYQEMQDICGKPSQKFGEVASMTFYFIKESAKDSASTLQPEIQLLSKYGDPGYIKELQVARFDQAREIFISSKDFDFSQWDKKFSGDALNELNRRLNAESDIDGRLSVLLNDQKGLLISETHGSDLNGQRFIVEHLDALKKQGVTTIGLEHLRADLAQPLIDDYLKTGVLSAELEAMILSKSEGHLMQLFEQAHSHGMKIIALDANSTARYANEHGLMYRAGAANNVAVEKLNGLPEGEKFVVVFGEAHLKSHPGMDSPVPGISHRLELPILKIDENNRFVVQNDDLQLRKIYDDMVNIDRLDLSGIAGGEGDCRAQAARLNELLAKPLQSEVERLNDSGQKVTLGDQTLTLGDLLMMGAKLDGKLVSLDWKLAEMDLNKLLNDGRLTLNADAMASPVHSSDTRLELVEKLDAIRRLNGDDSDTSFLAGSDESRSKTTALMESWNKVNSKLTDADISAANVDVLKDAVLYEADRQDRMFGPENVRTRFPLKALCKGISRFSTGLSMAMFPGSAFAIVDGFVKGNDYEAGRELGGMLADGVDMLVDTLAESTKIASVASKFSNVLGKISGGLGGLLSAPFSIWAAVDTFKGLDVETDGDRRTDLIVNGALQVGSAVLSVASGIAGIVSAVATAGSAAAVAASAFGPIGAAVGVAISLATGIYNAVRLCEGLKDAGISAGDRALAGFVSFFGFPIPERIAKEATINTTREQLESAAKENFDYYRQLGVDKFVYSHKAVGTKFHSNSAARVEEANDIYHASEEERAASKSTGMALYNERKKAWDLANTLHQLGVSYDQDIARFFASCLYPNDDVEQLLAFSKQMAGAPEPMLESFTGYDAGVKEDPGAVSGGVRTTLFALGGGYDVARGDHGRNNVFLMNETAEVDFAGADKNDTFEVVGGWVTGKLDGGADKDTLSLQSYYAEDGGQGFDVRLSPVYRTDYGRVINREHDSHTRQNVNLSLKNIENVFGSQRSDIISGNDADNLLIGNGGDDELYGGFGADQLRGGHGSDLLWGGRGMDSYIFSVDDLIREGDLDTIDNYSNWSDEDGSPSEDQDVLMLDVDTLAMRREGDDLLLSVNAGWQAANRFFSELRVDLQALKNLLDDALQDFSNQTVWNQYEQTISAFTQKYVVPLRECGETIHDVDLESAMERFTSLESWQEKQLVEQLAQTFREKNPNRNDVIKVKDYYADSANRHLTLMDSLGNLYLPNDLATGDYVADKDGNITVNTLQLQSRCGYEVNLYSGEINENPVGGGNENKRTKLLNGDVVDVIGSRHADNIFGDDRDNVIQGRGGNDNLYGGDGDDILVAGVAGDYGVSMSGGNGKDTYLIREGQGRIFIGAQGDGKNTDRIVLSSGYKQVSYGGSVYRDVAVNYNGTDIHINLNGTTDKLEFSFGKDRYLGELVWDYQDGRQQLKSLDLSGTDLASYRVDLSQGRYEATGTSHGWNIGYAADSEAVSVLGSRGNDTFVANGHFNYFEGGKGADTYEVGAGNGGTKVIYNYDTDGSQDTLKLGDAATLSRLSYQRQGDNLLVLQLGDDGNLSEAKSQILVKDWFKGNAYQHMTVQAADGKSHSAADINVLTRYTALLQTGVQSTELPEKAAAPVPRFVELVDDANSLSGWNVNNGGNGFAVGEDGLYTSYQWCSRTRRFDVSGLIDTYGANAISVSESFHKVGHIDDNYRLSVRMLDSNGNELYSWSTGDRTVGDQSELVTHSLEDYGSDVHYIEVTDAGKDNEWWAGQYGARLEGLSVKFETNAVDANVDTLRLAQLTAAMSTFGSDAGGEGGSASQDSVKSTQPVITIPEVAVC
ncbi:membrane-targeted effector domain-containing toxin [Photobacterium alginatilyticum]|uniref:Membrane-targeted effector domain-containing toxin n=1 Tax=Photobacterium alginatilyticum TaxID=1775171 RepID=A0ABW9YC59_9GAMM|nr:membrane-targeted effector domain-containing toxin [Photobacterium alginatilyticum]NBI51308.1 membrane-targeted effector domain-containing toxin [Photobacterium alginatilyticum]